MNEEMREDLISTWKIAAQLNMSMEDMYHPENTFALLAGPRYTPGEIKLFNQAKKDRIARLHETWTEMSVAYDDDLGIGAVLALHEPNEYGSCDGDHGREEGSEWPCRTVEVIADVYGFDLEQVTL